MSRTVRLTARDLQLLSFVAEHRLVLETQVRELVGASPEATRARLRSLAGAGFLSYRRVFQAEPAYCQIERKGLAAIASGLPPPRLNLAEYEHDVGVAWVWLAARDGRFGPERQVIGEREMRSDDRRADREGEPYAVRLGGFGRRGQELLHYPDLLLVTPDVQRVGVELELTAKGRARREGILAGYGADGRVDAVLYLVESALLGRAIEASARRMGVANRVHVRRFSWGGHKPAPTRASAREPAAAGIEAST